MPLVQTYFIIPGLAILSVIVVLLNQVPSVPVEILDDECKTLACNESAAEILNNMDSDVLPCDNFYKFSCGGYIQKTRIPNTDTSVSFFHVLNDKIIKQLRTVLDEPSSPNEPKYIRMFKNYYESCMNQAAIEKRGLTPFKTKLKELGGWPVLEGPNWNETNFDWLNSIREFQQAGFENDYFLSLTIRADPNNSTKKVLTIDGSSVGFWRRYLIQGMHNKKVEIYYKYMVDIAVMLGAPRNNATVELKKALNLEISLAEMKLQNTNIFNQSSFNNPMTVKELSERYPSIPWLKFINDILAPHHSITNNEIVIVTVPKFVSDLIELMNKIPKKVQANYALWRAVQATLPYLNEEITSRDSKYEMELMGTVKSKPRWEKCVRELSESPAVNAMYIRKYFNGATKEKSIEMVADIMTQLKKTLQTIDWMDNESRKHALNKAAAIASYVGYPDEFFNDTILEEEFQELDLTDDNFQESRLSLMCKYYDDYYRDFRKPIDDRLWRKHAKVAVVNAFYHSPGNSINIPAGILQGVFFNADRPRYMNYAAIGSVIAHEITHAFDDIGRQFDEHGNVKDWWTTVTDEKYRQKAQCIIDQYSNYTIEEIGKKVDGSLTQGENIADNGGLKIAYLAYKNWSEKNDKEQSLPGLKFTPQQMFWISAANTWCFKYRKEALKINSVIDTHSPAKFRILGPFHNLPEFAVDFNCPIGSKMNPKDKCNFW